METTTRAHHATLSPVRPADVAALSMLCGLVHRCCFDHLWDDGGAVYLEQACAPAILHDQLDDPDTLLFFIQCDAARCGYVGLRLRNDLEDARDGAQILHLGLLPSASGLGLGTQALAQVVDICRTHGRRYLWLHVADSAVDPILFCLRRGFRIIGETMLTHPRIRPVYRRMWRLKRDLDA